VGAHPAERRHAVVERRGVAVLGRESVVDADHDGASSNTELLAELLVCLRLITT
jgi:hypothetical protein